MTLKKLILLFKSGLKLELDEFTDSEVILESAREDTDSEKTLPPYRVKIDGKSKRYFVGVDQDTEVD